MNREKTKKMLPLIMAITNSFFMSLVMCIVNIGFHPPFAMELIKSFFIGLIVTVPISYLLPAFLIGKNSKNEKK